MKKYIYAIAAALVFFMGCKDSNENLVQERDVAVVPKMSDPSPAYFSDNIEASYVQFDLSLAPGQSVEKASIEVSRIRGGKIDKSGIVKEITIPATGLKVTATEVIQALGIPVSDYKLNDIFRLCILTTKSGKTTRSPAAFQVPVVCYFDPSMLVGSFDYVSEEWEEDGRVTLVADPDDPFKIYIDDYAEVIGLTGNGNRIVLNVNPNNFKVSGPKIIIADNLEEWGIPSPNSYAFEPVAGSYSACDEKYTITFNISLSNWGNQGNYVFIFTKAK